MQPVLSADCDIIIVNNNAGALLARCVGAVQGVASRIIVVDNDSQDDSLALLQQAVPQNERLRLIRTGRNLGFSAGCNIGIAASTANHLLFLNPDCVMQPGSLQRLLAVLQHDATLGMVGGLLTNPDGTEQAGGRRSVPTPWRSLVRVLGLAHFSSRWPTLFPDFNLHEQPLPAEPVEVEAISGALMLVRRQAMEDVGLWDEGYFLHCEDIDWCMRFRQRGWKIFFVPDAPVVHEQGACSRARPVFVEWHKHRGMMRFYGKFFRHQYPGVLGWLINFAVWLRFAAVVLRIQARKLLPGAKVTHE